MHKTQRPTCVIFLILKSMKLLKSIMQNDVTGCVCTFVSNKTKYLNKEKSYKNSMKEGIF